MRIFKEEQRFGQLWIILLILISTLVALGVVIGVYLKNPDSFSVIELMLIISLTILLSRFIFFFKLITRIDEEGIHYKFFPFHLRFRVKKWNEINKAYVRTYNAFSEYGGWGIKGGTFWNKSKGIAINVSGDIGIQLELKNGKKILIGTQKKDQAERILATYKTKTDIINA